MALNKCLLGSVLLSEHLSKESNDILGKYNNIEEMKVSLRGESKHKLNIKLKDNSKEAIKPITGSWK